MKYSFILTLFILNISSLKSQICVNLDNWSLIADNEDGTCTYNISIIVNSSNGASGDVTFTLNGSTVHTELSCVCNPATISFPVTVACGTTINVDANYDAPGNGNDCAGSTGNIVLPVEWISYKVTKKGNSNLISWTVIENNANKEYVIERSQDGSSFEQIGTQENEGAHNERHDYTFSDNKPFVGLNYYRIKQIDQDGSFIFSNLMVIESSLRKKTSIYPNPFRDIIIMDSDYISSWNITNLYGQVIKSGDEKQIDTADIPSGIYFLQIVNGFEIEINNIIKN